MNEESQKNILKTTKIIFQNREVKLATIVDNESKNIVKGDIFNRILSEEKISIGRVTESTCIKYLHRRVKIIKKEHTNILVKTCNNDKRKKLGCEKPSSSSSEDSKPLENFFDLPDNVVLVTGEPGIGKSTLLTHLTIKTNKLKPKVWIVRINLLEHLREFSKCNEDKKPIDFLEILNFMCQVIFRNRLGKEDKLKITLKEKDNVVYLKKCIANSLIEFELNLFLHFYNKREMIFLFDGFDEICPYYTDIVIKCLNIVRNHLRKHRMWITSRSYNEINTNLKEGFGPSYEIEHFSNPQIENYLQKFWESELEIEELNSKNVMKFLKFISGKSSDRL
ncbi:hypothetical protein PYW08_003681 [Mythimna loreyi]|uniref:Uncharacterized protein n=1 Tax=Mythimna loreyi TaxID=667449 RepID=A0ACC2QUC8_9NEOP|nr:hypothetical protein PYW08_003681 [Mythimna loreyi]